jgi:hypothetical protein
VCNHCIHMLQNKTVDDVCCFTIAENGFMIAFNHPHINCLLENLQQNVTLLTLKEVSHMRVHFNSKKCCLYSQ